MPLSAGLTASRGNNGLDLHTASTRFIAASLLEAVAVSIGVHRTPGGLHIAA